MNEEIEKILSRLERIDHKEYRCAFEFADSGTFDETCRCFEERKEMANYINALQKENKHLNLQLDQALQDYDELQQKIDKALCCLKSTDGNVFDYMIIEDAIDILKGE